jgi:hypothetical protein
LSDVGGMMGLLLGLSIYGLVEMAFGLGGVIMEIWTKLFNNGNNSKMKKKSIKRRKSSST